MKRSQTGNGLAPIQRAITFNFFPICNIMCARLYASSTYLGQLSHGSSKGFFVAVVFVRRWKITKKGI